jgi:hypothetical protein
MTEALTADDLASIQKRDEDRSWEIVCTDTALVDALQQAARDRRTLLDEIGRLQKIVEDLSRHLPH